MYVGYQWELLQLCLWSCGDVMSNKLKFVTMAWIYASKAIIKDVRLFGLYLQGASWEIPALFIVELPLNTAITHWLIPYFHNFWWLCQSDWWCLLQVHEKMCWFPCHIIWMWDPPLTPFKSICSSPKPITMNNTLMVTWILVNCKILMWILTFPFSFTFATTNGVILEGSRTNHYPCWCL